MKKLNILLIVSVIFISTNIHSQVKKDTIKAKTSSFNIIDAQLGAFKTMLGDTKIDGIDFNTVNNYNDLLNQTKGLSGEEKTHYKALYELQKKEPNQKTKDSIGKVISALIMKTKKDKP